MSRGNQHTKHMLTVLKLDGMNSKQVTFISTWTTS